jgi:hypothetical protein
MECHSLVIFLPGGIPEGQLDPLSIHIDIGNIILKNGRNVDLYSCTTEIQIYVS